MHCETFAAARKSDRRGNLGLAVACASRQGTEAPASAKSSAAARGWLTHACVLDARAWWRRYSSLRHIPARWRGGGSGATSMTTKRGGRRGRAGGARQKG